MKVFCALMTMTGRFGRIFLIRGNRSNAFSSGITDVGDDEIALALADPAPQRRRVAGQPHLVSGARKSLVREPCGWRCRRRRQVCYLRALLFLILRPVRHATAYPKRPRDCSGRIVWRGCTSAAARGTVVFRGWDSHSMMPP